MRKLTTIGSLATLIASCFMIAAADAQEYDIMTGRLQGGVPSTVFSFGENPAATDFPPRSRSPARPRIVYVEPSASYCVRTCDGRYFPAPSGDSQSAAQGCKSLCPASEMKVYSGSSIGNATSKDGRPYSALANAFRYRKELVAACTCNGKDVVGLASVKPSEDKTLRRGDIVVQESGLEVVKRIDDGNVSYAKASASTRGKYERLPVMASD